MGETFADIPGYEGAYRISTLGRVKSVERECRKLLSNGEWGTRIVPEKVLKTQMWGMYPAVKLSLNGVSQKRKIHELVLTTFEGPRPEGFVGCHWDGDLLNNKLSNLRWATPKENEDDKARHGRTARGQGNGNSKLTDKQVEKIILSKKLYRDIANQYGISEVWVSMIKTGKARATKTGAKRGRV